VDFTIGLERLSKNRLSWKEVTKAYLKVTFLSPTYLKQRLLQLKKGALSRRSRSRTLKAMTILPSQTGVLGQLYATQAKELVRSIPPVRRGGILQVRDIPMFPLPTWWLLLNHLGGKCHLRMPMAPREFSIRWKLHSSKIPWSDEH